MSKGRGKWPLLWILYSLFWSLYFGILWKHQLVMDTTGLVAGSDRTWADGAAHLSYISAFSERGFWLGENPLFVGEVFSYPPAADWLAAGLVKIGIPLHISFSLIGLFLSLITVQMLYWFYWVVFGKNHATSTLASLLFLWSGGLGFWYRMVNYFTKGGLGNLPPRATEMTDYGIRFINTIDAELLPQRAFLLGLPVGLGILVMLWQLWSGAKIKRVWLILMGVIFGMLPLIHPHTFIVMVGVVGWWVVYFGWKRSFKREWWWFLMPGIIVGGVFSWLQTRGVGDTFFWIKFGWLAGDMGVSWIWFWLLNWGFWLPSAILGFLKLPKNNRWFLVPFIGLFMLTNVVVFQPYDWDNSKLLTWVHLAFSGTVGWWMITMLRTSKTWSRLLVFLLFFLSIASGYLDSMRLLNVPDVSLNMYSPEEYVAAEWVKMHTDQDALFLTSDTHRHFIPALSGRPILMGYRGWLWSYGIDYAKREREVLAMFAGGDLSLTLLREYGVDYVVISPAEKDNFYRADELFFEENFAVVFESSLIKIHQVR